MSKKEEVISVRVLTLREMFGGQIKVTGSIVILNECHETLLHLSEIGTYATQLSDILSPDLLDRYVLSYGPDIYEGRMVIVVNGVDDAE